MPQKRAREPHLIFVKGRVFVHRIKMDTPQAQAPGVLRICVNVACTRRQFVRWDALSNTAK